VCFRFNLFCENVNIYLNIYLMLILVKEIKTFNLISFIYLYIKIKQLKSSLKILIIKRVKFLFNFTSKIYLS